MNKKSVIKITIFFLIILFQENSSGYTNTDSAFSNNIKLSVSSNIIQSILLPSYASYQSENYVLSSLQAFIDLCPFLMMSTNRLTGDKGIVILFLPLFWVFNRLTAIPLNYFSVTMYNERIENHSPYQYLPSFSDKSHLGFVGAIGGDCSYLTDNMTENILPSLGILFKYKNIRSKLFINSNFNSKNEYHTMSYKNGNYYDVRTMTNKHVTFSLDYRYRFHKSMCINPGIALDFFKLQCKYYLAESGIFIFDPSQSFKKISYFVSPKIALEITQFKRLGIEQTIAFPMIIERKIKMICTNARISNNMIYSISLNYSIF